ncbi:MAG: Ig-like domain-containing protein [Candidatus Sulfotelmatobacter sp.]
MGPAGAGKTSRGAAAQIRLVLMLSFAATLSGCGGMPPGMGTSTPASANKSLTSISLSPVAATVALGQSQQFTATGVFSDGSKQDLTQVVSWSSAPPSVASISQSGLVLGKLTGSATITARSGTITASDTLVISPAVLMSIAVSPQTVSVPKGAAKQLTAIATFSDGSQQNLTNSATWSIAPSGVATVNATGMVTAQAMGSAAITASSASVSGTGALTVLPAVLVSIAVSPQGVSVPKGNTQQLSAIAVFSDGTQQNVTNSTLWSIAPSGVATVSAAGTVTAQAAGSATVIASLGSVSGNDTLTVSPAVLVSISIAPSNSSVVLGTSKQLISYGIYSDGTSQDLTQSATWSSANSSTVSVGSAGLAFANAVGSATISASSNGQTGSAKITVMPQLLVNYFSNNSLTNPDATVQVTNVGMTGGPLCAMIYVFDARQEMSECCGCSISPDGIRTLSVQNDLTSHPATGITPQAGIIEIFPATSTTNQSCDASNASPAGELVAWGTHVQLQATNAFVFTESPFDLVTLPSTESAVLQGLCGFLIANAPGVCTCGTGE